MVRPIPHEALTISKTSERAPRAERVQAQLSDPLTITSVARSAGLQGSRPSLRRFFSHPAIHRSIISVVG